MARIEPIRIKLRLPPDLAQDVIVKHALSAREWLQLPFDASLAPVEIEGLEDSPATRAHIAKMLPQLLGSILEFVGGAEGSFDAETSILVAGAVCAYAVETGIRLAPFSDRTLPAGFEQVFFAPAPRTPAWTN